MAESDRRPVRTRQVGAFRQLALRLVRLGFTPNQVSVSSSVFAAVGAWAILRSVAASPPALYAWLLLGILGIQGRLICNLIDGLMAVEGGKKTKTGELFNDLPDRVSDTFLLLAAGMAARSLAPAWALGLGVAATVLAFATAYIRQLGSAMGTPPFFIGPMAKQHRMFVLNLALVGSAVEAGFHRSGWSWMVALVVITLGSAWTCVRRLRSISVFVNGL